MQNCSDVARETNKTIKGIKADPNLQTWKHQVPLLLYLEGFLLKPLQLLGSSNAHLIGACAEVAVMLQ